MHQIIIAGGPKTGKTTLAKKLAAEHDIVALSSDDLMHMGWSEASEELAKQMNRDGGWVIEGVACARALRKWFKLYPELAAKRAPASRIIHLTVPKVEQNGGQATMAKGELTVWTEIRPALIASLGKFGGLIEDEETEIGGFRFVRTSGG